MNEGLKENHSILGLHLIGNELGIDSLGFISDKNGNQASIEVRNDNLLT